MKTKITYEDIMSYKPCYDPAELGDIDKEKALTIPQFVRLYRDRVKSKEDIVWVLCRNEYMSDKDMRLFAVWSAREALKLDENPDPRSVAACDVAEMFAHGKATKEELAAAWDAALYSAMYAAMYAAMASASASAWYAARNADWDATWDAQLDHLLTYFKSEKP